MSKFTGSLRIEEVEAGKIWKLIDPICYEVTDKGSGKLITVPTGFITDGATIPVALRGFIAVWGTYGRAAVIHDYLYSCLKQKKPHIYGRTRKEADAVFLEAMEVSGTSWLLRHAMWLAVRIFGGMNLRST